MYHVYDESYLRHHTPYINIMSYQLLLFSILTVFFHPGETFHGSRDAKVTEAWTTQLIMGRNPQTDIAPIGRNPEGKDHLPTTPTPRLIFGCLRQFQGGLMWLDHSWMIVVRHSGQWVMAVWASYFDLTRQKALVQAKLANYDSLLKLFFYRIRSFWQCMKLIIPSGNCMGSHFERSSANLKSE